MDKFHKIEYGSFFHFSFDKYQIMTREVVAPSGLPAKLWAVLAAQVKDLKMTYPGFTLGIFGLLVSLIQTSNLLISLFQPSRLSVLMSCIRHPTSVTLYHFSML